MPARHRYLQNLSNEAAYDEDDFYDEGGDDELLQDVNEELSPEDAKQMKESLASVREVIGSQATSGISDREIEDSLWHYYYDVEKTINYVLSHKAGDETAEATKPKAQTKSSEPVSKKTKGPSPDDIVANAQSNAKGFSNSKPKSTPVKEKTAKKTEQATPSTMAPEAASKVKSKNLDVPAEYAKESRKESANFVVIGHVDAGKSTLMGRLLYDLKQVDQRTIEKYKKEAASLGKSSFHLAWVLDQGSEERSRGVTIDIATNRFETEKTSFTILDAPGHQDFIPNMIAGTSQADFAVLVIDASVGAFESGLRGQTKEHALLARSMGIPRLVVAVNKLDAVQWSKDRFDEIRGQVAAFLSAAGFQPKNVTFVACSGLSGDNLTRRCEDEASKWYTGPLLVEALESTETIRRKIQGSLRLPISDVFRGGVQYPLSISGRIETGNVQVGDRMIDIPTNEIVFAKAIEVDGKASDYAVAGQNAVIHLVELENAQLRPGDILCSTEAPLVPLKSFTMKALAFEHLTPMDIDVHKGRLHVAAKITVFISILDKGTGEIIKKRPKVVKPGEIARVKVEVEGDNVVPVEKGGRVVLRANGETVAAGLVD